MFKCHSTDLLFFAVGSSSSAAPVPVGMCSCFVRSCTVVLYIFVFLHPHIGAFVFVGGGCCFHLVAAACFIYQLLHFAHTEASLLFYFCFVLYVGDGFHMQCYCTDHLVVYF